MPRTPRTERGNRTVLIVRHNLVPYFRRHASRLPQIRIVIRHAGHGHHIAGIHFHGDRITGFGIRMRPARNGIAVDPIDLVHNRLLGDHLDLLVDGGMQIISFDRRGHFRNPVRHVARVDRHALIAVFAAKLRLVVHFQSIVPDKLLRRIFKCRILTLSFPDGIIKLNIFRRTEFF
ncbi:hypothetical protein D1872_234690 [compost metagenome]